MWIRWVRLTVAVLMLGAAPAATAQDPTPTAQDPTPTEPGSALTTTEVSGPVDASGAARSDPMRTVDGFAIEATTRVDGRTTDRHRILFAAGIAYDVMDDGSRFFAIYDHAGVTLLDRREQTRTFIDHRTMIDAAAEAEAAAARSPNAARFGLKIRPELRDDVYSAHFGPFQYDIHCEQPSQAFISGDYAKFADAAARLNLLRGRGFPPFARLALNRQISLDGRVPIETVVSVRGGSQVQTFVCRNVRSELLPGDQEWIDRLENMKQLFTSIPLDQFDQAETIAHSPTRSDSVR